MANTADISRGMIIKLDGSLYTVVEFGEKPTNTCIRTIPAIISWTMRLLSRSPCRSN